MTTGGRERFVGHPIILSIRNAHAEEVVALSGTTDDFGKVVFEFATGKQFFGENTVEIVDNQYGIAVVLDESVHFIVYEEEKDDMSHEKGQKVREIAETIKLPRTSLPQVFAYTAEHAGNNGTIAIRESLSWQRMEPGDP